MMLRMSADVWAGVSMVVVGVVTVPGLWRMPLTMTTTALPLFVVDDRCGRAVLGCAEAPVGDGRG